MLFIILVTLGSKPPFYYILWAMHKVTHFRILATTDNTWTVVLLQPFLTGSHFGNSCRLKLFELCFQIFLGDLF